MKVALFLNPTKAGIFEYAQKVICKLESLGVQVLINKDYDKILLKRNIYLNENIEDIIKFCDVMLIIGGDGTIIHFAKYAAKFSKPILSINFGRLGFVAEIEKDELDKLEFLVSGNYNIESRALLEVTACKDETSKVFWAINDVVISKGENTKIVDFSIFLEGNEMCRYRADGMIIATSTGSTAYSLSAGGPIVDPKLDCMLLTPVCAHSMFARTIIFSYDNLITISTYSKEGNNVSLNIDGINVLNLSNFYKINVGCLPGKVKMITFNNKCFYDNLSKKLLNRYN